MRIPDLIRNIRKPPPESLVGYMTLYEGRFMRNMPFFILINLAWIFMWPVIAGQPFFRVILPTIISVPIFVYLHLCTYFYGGPAEKRMRYVVGQFLVGYALAYVNQSSIGYSDLRLLRHRLLDAAAPCAQRDLRQSRAVCARDRAAGPQRANIRQRHAARRAVGPLGPVHRLQRPAADGTPAQRGRGHAPRPDGGTRTHRARPARPAGTHAVGGGAEI